MDTPGLPCSCVRGPPLQNQRATTRSGGRDCDPRPLQKCRLRARPPAANVKAARDEGAHNVFSNMLSSGDLQAVAKHNLSVNSV